ncbi:MAG TPA: hypothetical protein DCS93_17675 [Microscillaceae bacterium]|nr:hypothetical protein [Microscillaceae bacterium]
MTKIKSKFSWVHTYLIFSLLFLLYVGMLIGVIFAYLSSNVQKPAYQYILWIIVLIVLTGLFVLSSLKIFRTITITNQSIVLRTVFKRQEILWSEVKALKLHGKENWLFTPQEATTFFLHNGEKTFFLNSLYRNTSLLKLALNTIKKQYLRNQPMDIQKLEQYKLEQFSQKTPNYPMTGYSGNFWLTINGIGLIFFFVATLFWLMVLLIGRDIEIGLFVFFSFLPMALFARQLNYFHLGKHHLVIKNHIWKPYTRIYHLDDIEEVVFDSVGNSSDGLRVITKDFKSVFFPAGSLRPGTWQKLEKALRKRKIRIRPKYF